MRIEVLGYQEYEYFCFDREEEREKVWGFNLSFVRGIRNNLMD